MVWNCLRLSVVPIACRQLDESGKSIRYKNWKMSLANRELSGEIICRVQSLNKESATSS